MAGIDGETKPPGHVQMLNMIARATGHRNVQALRASMQAPAAPLTAEDRSPPLPLSANGRDPVLA